MHRIVLCAANTYFSDELENAPESVNGKQRIILDATINNGAMYMLIEYCYTGRITITTENVENLLHAANTYEFSFVKKKCIDFLINQVGHMDALHIWRLASLYSSKRLQRCAMAIVCDTFMDLVKSVTYQKLDANQVHTLVSCEDIFVGSEKDVFQAIVDWVAYNPLKRRQHFPSLLEAVRLAGISFEVATCQLNKIQI